MNRIRVLSGSLDEEPLAGVIEAMTLTRQLSCVEVTSPLGAVEGAVWMKSGQLLEATAGARHGIDALRYLLGRSGTYEVFRAEGALDPSIRPLMPIADALEAAAAATGSQSTTGAASTPPMRLATGTQTIEPPPLKPIPAVPMAPVHTAPQPVAAPVHAPVHAPSYAPVARPAPAAVPAPAARPAPAQAPSPALRPAPAPAPAARPAPAPSAARSAPAYAPETRAPASRDAHSTGGNGPVLTVFANKGGVGKTTFAVNLAVTLARRGMRVVLVDADPRNDVGTALSARRDTSLGLFDVLDGSMSLRDVLLETALPGFTVLPAGGVGLPEDRFQAATMQGERLAGLLAALSGPGSVVIVDTPPGLRGITHSVLRASTHAVAIVQAEPIALRSAALVPRALDALPARERPAFVGVVLNMLDRRVGASLGMLEEACRVFGADAVLDIAIPRSGVFIEASESGAPVALLDGGGTHAVGWIFESLASAILARAGLATPRFAEMRLL